jgi:RNA polymerase sigma-70 factor (ECF subfamily)
VDQALPDEAQAIADAAAGDAASFGTLVERYQQVAFRTAWLVVRDAAAAEDVAQEAFIRAFRSIGSFRAGEAFRPWLLRIVTNQALNHVRGRSRRHGVLGRFAALAPRSAPSPHEAVAASGESAAVLRALDELPPGDRVVLYLRHFVELPEREIAAAIGRPAGTVKSRLHRASARLRRIIETRYPELMERADA